MASEVFLHGDLELWIEKATSLPNMDLTSDRLRRLFSACTSCTTQREPKEVKEEHHSHNHRRKIITSDSYVTVNVPQATLARTRVISNSQNPTWDETFRIHLAHSASHLEFSVKDNDNFGAQLIGKVKVPAERIASGEEIQGPFLIIGNNGKPPKKDSNLYMKMRFVPCRENGFYEHGIAGDPEQGGVRNTYFPLRKGSMVTLYQDAHVGENAKLPRIELDDGKIFQHNNCWEDICYAISEAHHMIYIVGWSVFYKIKLVREPTKPLPRGGDLTLGELLKYKSEEGVRVLLLIWDDKTSHDTLFLNTPGVMATHDEETRKFFKHSSVICVLSPRYPSSKLSYIKQKIVGTFFTHHQKCVLVDTQAPGNYRKVTAFMGGLDLCDGRYDTPEHRLFRDLETTFKDDIHQPNIPAGIKAPRQPWHDLHCKIEGPAAYDVLMNFAQRWRKATRWREFGLLKKKISKWHDDAMIKIERISWILSPVMEFSEDESYMLVPKDDPDVYVSEENHPENWHVQIFRSIDSGSLKGFPKSFGDAHKLNLICSKNLVIDRSIQTSYIQAIRSAQHFIYIENQYFLGSSYAWPSYKNAGADHMIPMELTQKIVSKIRAKERFSVYVVVPMWPEGDPKSITMQEILYWQSQTMHMMYQTIAEELKAMQLVDSHPLDYLNFYCLGNREEIPSTVSSSGDTEKICDSFKFQRFMIYVHAKGMIVDDEYLIIGSANINQRSMAGTKDTEIAMGAYQPQYTWKAKGSHPHGQVYGYRMSLWAEHLANTEDCFMHPESLECVKLLNKVAEDNWKTYADNEFKALKGHLMKYPLLVEADGQVRSLPGYENFPDVGGRIIGAHSPTLPDVLTT